MQQPPHGRPLPGQQPQRPPAYVPPQPQPQQRQPYPQQPQPYQQQPAYQPPVQQQPSTPLPPPARARKSRGSLRFLAGTCVFSAWATLVLSILFAIGTFMAGASAAAMMGAASRSQQYFPSTTPTMPSVPSMPSPMDPSGGLLGQDGASPSPMSPSPGPFTGISMLQQFIPALSLAGGVFTLVSGIVTFLLFMGLGQACYVLLDLEEQQGRMENMLQILTLRPGGR